MRRFFILLTIFCFELSSQAQNPFNHHKFRLGVSFSPFYSYRNLDAPDSFQSTIDQFNNRDQAKFGYSGGINLLIDLHKRITLETGVLFTNRGTKLSENLTGDDGTGNFINIGKIDKKYHYNYLDVPVKFNLNLVNRKLRFFVAGGINTSIFLYESQSSKVTNEEGVVNRGRATIENARNTHIIFSAIAGVGIDWYVIKRLSLRFEPMFRYGLYNSRDSDIDYLPYAIGMNLGLHIGFK